MNQNKTQGLTTSEANKIREKIGSNVLPERYTPGFCRIFFFQFKSPFIYVLLVAAVASAGLGQYVNSIFIVIVLFLNATIGAVQEFAADKAASSLKKMVPQWATVLRDGKQCQIKAVDVVPGDLVYLSSGDKIPADMKLIKTKELLVDESMLTGESKACIKDSLITSNSKTFLADKRDIGFAGTVVLRGRGTGLVISTGSQTEIGKISEATSVCEISKPPLMQRIEKFTLRISFIMLILIVLIFIITFFRGDDIYDVFLLGVALAVSAIPEGLPVAITVALAIGMKRMAKCGVIVRKLIAIESLGSCTYIATDKTGTLTTNKMTIQKILLPNDNEYMVSGDATSVNSDILATNNAKDITLKLLISAGVLTSEAKLECIDGSWIEQGDTVDLAFLSLAEKFGVDNVMLKNSCKEIDIIPYESENGFAASLNLYESSHHLFVKGSVERVLGLSKTSRDNDDLSHIERQSSLLTQEGYRVIAVAHRVLDHVPKDINKAMCELEFLGLVGITDPCRPEVIDAIKQCREAQIKVVMVTGDNPETAAILSQKVGISRYHIEREKDIAVTGTELKLAKEKGQAFFNKLAQKARVFARVEPQQKKDLIDSLISQGEFIAMTGDGVNDAPALRHAHVGISMGLRGTDVARESSDIILTDDNFASIVGGIMQGRIVYNNIRKVIFLLISTGAAEVTLILLSLLFGLPLPLMPIQLLWLNLITNGIQDVALVFEPEEGDELKKPPRHPKEPIFNRLMIERIVVNGLFMGIVTFIVFWSQITKGLDIDSARNTTLLLMVLFENVHVFNSRSETKSIFKHYLFGNPLLLFGMITAQAIHIAAMFTPGLSSTLKVSPVSFHQWSQLLIIALILIVVDELHKFWCNRKRMIMLDLK